MVGLAPTACDVGAAVLVPVALVAAVVDAADDEVAVVFESDPHPATASPTAKRATAAPAAVLCVFMETPVVGKLNVHAKWRTPS
jgi:hypothetical protein